MKKCIRSLQIFQGLLIFKNAFEILSMTENVKNKKGTRQKIFYINIE